MFNVFTNSSGQLALQTVNGNFITAVGGGGRTTNVLHTDAVSVAAWEEFRIAKTGAVGAFSVSIQTSSNNFLTAVGAGGQTTNAIHSDAKAVNAWETFFIRQALGPSAAYAQYFIVDTKKNQALAARSGGGQTQNTIEFLSANSNFPQAWARFTIVPLGNGEFALRTANDNFVTAVNGGGLNTGTATSDNIHTDATVVSTWERFRFVPSNAGSFIIQTASGNFLGQRTVGGSAEGEYSTNINIDSGSPTMFWLIPTTFF